MRTMKDTERLMIIIRIFLDCNGKKSAREIAEYINNCPVALQTIVTSTKIAMLLRGKRGIRKIRGTPGSPTQYYVG